MFHAKKYMYIFTVINVFSCSCSLWGMKEILRIKNHAVTIKKNEKAKEVPDILDEKSIQVFYIPAMKTVSPSSLPWKTTVVLDKRIVAFGYDEIIKIINITTGFCKKTIPVKDKHITNMVKITKNIFATGHFGGNIRIWDITKSEGEECINILKEHCIWIHDLLKINNAFIASCDIAGIINTWDITKPAPYTHIKKIDTIPLEGATLTYDKNETLIAAGTHGDIAAFSIQKKATIKPLYSMHCNGFINSIAYISGKKIAAGNDFGKIVILDLENKEKRVLQSENRIFNNNNNNNNFLGTVTRMFTLSNNTILSCTHDGIITVWHPEKTYDWFQELDAFTLLQKNADHVASFTYEEETQMLIVTTKKGIIITCDCNKISKNNINFFKNLKNSTKTGAHKDISFFC